MMDIIIVVVAVAIVVAGLTYQIHHRRKNKGGCSSCGGSCPSAEKGCAGEHSDPPDNP